MIKVWLFFWKLIFLLENILVLTKMYICTTARDKASACQIQIRWNPDKIWIILYPNFVIHNINGQSTVPPICSSLGHVSVFQLNAFANSKKAMLWKLDVSREKLIVAFLYIYSPCCAFCALHKSLLTHFHLKSLFCHLRALL